jgi:hypothetical protein
MKQELLKAYNEKEHVCLFEVLNLYSNLNTFG